MRLASFTHRLVLVMALSALQFPIWAQSPFEDSPTSPGASRSTAQTSQSAPAAVATSREVAIGEAWVNVRTGPGTSHSVITTLQRGSTGTVLAERNGWSQVRFDNGTTGWVRSDLLSGSGSNQPSATTKDKLALEKSFSRWDRQLGNDALDFSKVPSTWQLGKAWKAFQRGDYK